MERILNPELDRIVLAALATRYKLLEKREGIHLSSLNYCLTKSYFDQVSPIDPTDTELLNFATGYGLQEIMFPAEMKTFEKDNILYRPDGVIQVNVRDIQLIEIKSTRSGVKRYQEGNLPETWITYMKGGCCIRETETYNLSVIYLAERPSARIISETILFEPEEIKSNWLWILSRKEDLEKALRDKVPPQPFTTAPAWMCESCRYKVICDAVIMLQGGKE